MRAATASFKDSSERLLCWASSLGRSQGRVRWSWSAELRVAVSWSYWVSKRRACSCAHAAFATWAGVARALWGNLSARGGTSLSMLAAGASHTLRYFAGWCASTNSASRLIVGVGALTFLRALVLALSPCLARLAGPRPCSCPAVSVSTRSDRSMHAVQVVQGKLHLHV